METSQLKRIPLFADVPDEDLRLIATFAESKEVDAGAVIMKEGGFSNEFMAIESGAVEIQRDGETVAELGAGEIFGEAGLLEKSRRNATVVAKEPTKLIIIKQWEMARMRKKLPHIVDEIKRTLEERQG
ncbi:MAG: family transcriptional regulator, cyclic receptor protein [Solirubrobacterales bacterium]|nr:family transcriptional regulator, cyclic receptor protein [Solirubrobacterales bacterium]